MTSQSDTCFGTHSTYEAFRKCSGRRGNDVYHERWSADDCAWVEQQDGIETYAVKSTDLDPKLPECTIGYALRWQRTRVKIGLNGRATLYESMSSPTKIFQSPARAVGYALLKDEEARDKHDAINAALDHPSGDPLLGDPEIRKRAEAAYVRGAMIGDMAEYERLRALLPKQEAP
jgi:hypothetical protein